MGMVRTVMRVGAIAVAVVLLSGLVLYLFFDLRIVLDGGSRPMLRFVESPAEQAERIRLHREAQRAEAVAAAAPVVPDTPVESPPAVDGAPSALDEAEETTVAEVVPAAPVPYWTDFRGPLRDGEYRERSVFVGWPEEGLTPVWKQPVGGGYASFVSAGGRAFTIEQRGPEEVAAAYDVATGRELWTSAWSGEFRETMGGDGPRATPTWADGVVYVLGAAGELRALDEASGELRWRTNILEENGAANLDWGMSAAPLVVDDAVIVLPGGPAGRSVVAYDRQDGTQLWSALDDQQAYTSPMLVTIDGVPQLLVLSAVRLMGLAVEGGEVLWDYTWPGFNGINAAQPLLIGDNRVFVSSGYGLGAAVVELAAGAQGFSVREVWRNNRMKNRFASSVLHEGVIYGLDESILAAVDAGTGELLWKGGRYGYGQLLLVDGHLIVLTENGDLALVRATRDGHEEVVRFPVLSGKTWNVPAIADGYLLVRNLAEMAAFDLREATR